MIHWATAVSGACECDDGKWYVRCRLVGDDWREVPVEVPRFTEIVPGTELVCGLASHKSYALLNYGFAARKPKEPT